MLVDGDTANLGWRLELAHAAKNLPLARIVPSPYIHQSHLKAANSISTSLGIELFLCASNDLFNNAS